MAYLKPKMRFYGKQRANITCSEISDRKLVKYCHVCIADARLYCFNTYYINSCFMQAKAVFKICHYIISFFYNNLICTSIVSKKNVIYKIRKTSDCLVIARRLNYTHNNNYYHSLIRDVESPRVEMGFLRP